MFDRSITPTSLQEIQELHTKRLILRAVKESDLPAMQRNFEDYETVRYLASTVPWPYPKDGAERWYRDMVLPELGKTNWTWVICRKEAP